jgi:hypothetical protein
MKISLCTLMTKKRLFDLLFCNTHKRPSGIIEMPLTEGILE